MMGGEYILIEHRIPPESVKASRSVGGVRSIACQERLRGREEESERPVNLPSTAPEKRVATLVMKMGRLQYVVTFRKKTVKRNR